MKDNAFFAFSNTNIGEMICRGTMIFSLFKLVQPIYDETFEHFSWSKEMPNTPMFWPTYLDKFLALKICSTTKTFPRIFSELYAETQSWMYFSKETSAQVALSTFTRKIIYGVFVCNNITTYVVQNASYPFRKISGFSTKLLGTESTYMSFLAVF